LPEHGRGVGVSTTIGRNGNTLRLRPKILLMKIYTSALTSRQEEYKPHHPRGKLKNKSRKRSEKKKGEREKNHQKLKLKIENTDN
jgi:hypothetical protein